MGDIFGADFLTNPKMATAEAVNIDLPDLGAVELPAFGESAPAQEEPRLMPSLNEVGDMRTREGLENLNAEKFFAPKRMSEEHLLKEKYEILRKFDRLAKMGVPMRKRFTLESPLEEMRTELEFIKKEKEADQTIKQFCDWYITGMSALEWSTKNVAFMKAFGLNLDGLSESAQMNVVDMEDDFEELYDLYGDKMKMHPLVRIPIRTCMMVYMVHLTNQMTLKAPIPNIDQILKTNPDIARQLATAAMQQQSSGMRAAQAPMAPPPSNPLAGLSSFMSGMVPPAPQQTNVRPPPAIKTAIRYPKPNPQPPAARAPAPAPAPPPPAREMKGPSVNIDDLLRSVNANVETKKVSTTPKKGGSTGKNSVTIKL
jgi:enamine deaminase RidA (YjgF/YER057c/UK114 family)